MEIRILSDQMEWEAQRVAAAFGMEECERSAEIQGYTSHIYLNGELSVEVVADDEVANLLQVGRRQGEYCEVFRDGTGAGWNAHGEPQAMRSIMARALYCLGFEDENVFADLNYSFTAHDKTEARLSLPREFWPKKWLDKEANPDNGTEWIST